jgi:hypothetical protein
MQPNEIYRILREIGAGKLYHANSVSTSCTFLEEGGLLSRRYVESHELRQTPQPSDQIDKEYSIWDLIFLDHVDIHYQGGRKRGPNEYGPVLFIFGINILTSLPRGTDIRITKMNPTKWRGRTEQERWFHDLESLRAEIDINSFGQMLMIDTRSRKLDFPDQPVQILLDDPRRNISSGENAYNHAERKLRAAARVGGIRIDINPHNPECRPGCDCINKYASYSRSELDFWFA